MKKKFCFDRDRKIPGLVKLLKIMKLSVFLILVSVAGVWANKSYSQNKMLNLTMRQATIKEVLNGIEKQSEFYFLYSENLINVERKVNVNIENKNIEQALDLLFEGTDIEYSVRDRIIVLKNAGGAITDLLTQQQRSISGKITDERGEPLPGVTIIIKGTTNGTVTGVNGSYTIAAKVGDVLQFSFVGMKSQEIKVVGQSTINVNLEADAIGLEEVVAVGYGVQKRSVVTGAISSLNSEDLLQSRPSNAAQALQGKASGVVLSSGSAQPGSAPKITIRGVGTNGNSNPLIIVDGLPMSDLNDINPVDIESIEVLKDATSSAIYGARAANGVILVTTKRAKKGQTSIVYNGFYGVQSAFNMPELMGTDDFLMMTKEAFANAGKTYPSGRPVENQGIDTDWLDVITNNAPVQEHNITATSGSEKSSTLLSLGYRDQDGIIGADMDKSFFRRYTARINTELDATDYLTVGANLNYVQNEKKGVGTGTGGNANVLSFALIMPPTTPVYDPVNGDERGYGLSTSEQIPENPLSFIERNGNQYNSSGTFFGNSYARINFLNDFEFKTDFALQIAHDDKRSYSPIFTHSANMNSDENSVSQQMNKSTFWQWENTLNYNKEIGRHSIKGLIGVSASRNNRVDIEGSRKNLPMEAQQNSNFWYLDSGDLLTSVNSGSASVTHSLASVFGRLSYNYAEKYMAEVVVRRDGSSNFGAKNKYAVFPGVSLGWNLTNEDFWNIPEISQLKLRASWGQNGNESIGAFNYTSIIANDQRAVWGDGGMIITGSSPKSLVNEDVKWETSEQLNIGADIGLFNSQLRVGIDYFNKTTKDLLFRRNIEAVRGNISPYYNVGSVKNTGIEFQLGYNFKVKDVHFSVDANATYFKNEVTSVGNENGYEEGGDWNNTLITRMEVGMPIGYFYGYKIDGIFQNVEEIQQYKDEAGNLTYPNASPGDFKWADYDGNGQITIDDRQMIGNPWPEWVYGVNLAAKWRGFDFSVFMNGKANVDVFVAPYKQGVYGNGNMPTFFLDRWTKEGDVTSIPRFVVEDFNQNMQKASEFWVKNASFLKIGTIELGYTIPKGLVNKAKISSLRIYGAIDNAAILTKYPYIDPDVGSMRGGDILSTGIDFGMYPQARTARLGLILNL